MKAGNERIVGQKCTSCGAPLNIEKQDWINGVVKCEFCGNSFQLENLAGTLDEETKEGLKMLSKFRRIMSMEFDEDFDQPYEKPSASKIQLENEPGRRFRADIPRAGFRLTTIPFAIFTLFWCGFMVMWNAIAIAQGALIMILFGLMHDAVGVFVLLAVLWRVFGKEELTADSANFTRVKNLMGIRISKSIPLASIQGAAIRVASQDNNRAVKGLYLITDSSNFRIASNAVIPEIRWLRTELSRFLKRET